MNKFKLNTADFSKINKKKISDLYFKKDFLTKMREATKKAFSPKYLYWDKFQFKKMPANLNKEESWYIVKMLRAVQSEKTIIKTEAGNSFSWIKLPRFEKFFHKFDLGLGGELYSTRSDINPSHKFKFISRGIMEEAIASSQLEGANTTRKAAKKMLRENIRPKNKSEQMIVNNYNAMLEIEENYKSIKLSNNLLLELHEMLTKDTIEKNEIGRFRKDSDQIIVLDTDGETVLHIPPKTLIMKKELKRFISFANDETEEEIYIHPVIKAIMIHFWIGYLHPFTDGNGRIGRILFYWYLLKKDYWAMSFLPISSIIKKSPIQYKKAFIYSEQDDNDLTYFIDYNIQKIELAMIEFTDFIQEKRKENSKMTQKAKNKFKLNDRQIAVLQYLVSDTESYTNPTAYQRIHGVSKATAIKDLKTLLLLHLVLKTKEGRESRYSITKDGENLFI